VLNGCGEEAFVKNISSLRLHFITSLRSDNGSRPVVKGDNSKVS